MDPSESDLSIDDIDFDVDALSLAIASGKWLWKKGSEQYTGKAELRSAMHQRMQCLLVLSRGPRQIDFLTARIDAYPHSARGRRGRKLQLQKQWDQAALSAVQQRLREAQLVNPTAEQRVESAFDALRGAFGKQALELRSRYVERVARVRAQLAEEARYPNQQFTSTDLMRK